MDRIVLGDNQFFGVNHMSEEKARAQAIRFQDTASIIEVLKAAYEEGIRTFMCTTHDRIPEVCDYFREHRKRYPGYQFYPCMPYAHKYANAVTEHGIIDALRKFLPDEGLVRAIVQGGVAVASKDVEAIMRMLVDAEMKMFASLRTPIIFLQNVVTDLLLGLGMKHMFRAFYEHIRSAYSAEAGFITMNLPRLLDALHDVGVPNPIICANINKIGFRMCGGVHAYEEAIAQRPFRPMAMSVFASGALGPREAVEYIAGQPRIQSIVFGASSKAHIRETKKLVEELLQA